MLMHGRFYGMSYLWAGVKWHCDISLAFFCHLFNHIQYPRAFKQYHGDYPRAINEIRVQSKMQTVHVNKPQSRF